MNVAVKLKESRVNAGYTQLEVKKKTGINNKSLSNWEKGVSYPSLPDLVVLAKLYDVSTDYLLGNDDTPPKVVPLIKENEFSEKEKERMRKIRQLAKHTQDYIDDTINREYAHQVEPPQPFKKVAM